MQTPDRATHPHDELGAPSTRRDTFRVGDAEVSRAVEWVGPLAGVADLFPDTADEVWDREAPWLSPDHYEGGGRRYRAAVQTWVVRSGGALVLVDTGVGNGRDRPQIPQFADLDTPYLQRLAALGVQPEDVDVVVNTHIHYDHVGWNTRAETSGGGTRWVPTFPNASYVIPRRDFDYFHPDNASGMRAPRTEDERRRFDGIRLVMADSVLPVVDAGQVQLWEGSFELPGGLHLEAAPGHTPGSSVVWLDRGPGAAFVGDLLHSPVQMQDPRRSCAFDVDPDDARRSRHDVVAHAARRRALVLPAHWPGHGGAVPSPTSASDGAADSFTLAGWADLGQL